MKTTNVFVEAPYLPVQYLRRAEIEIALVEELTDPMYQVKLTPESVEKMFGKFQVDCVMKGSTTW